MAEGSVAETGAAGTRVSPRLVGAARPGRRGRRAGAGPSTSCG